MGKVGVFWGIFVGVEQNAACVLAESLVPFFYRKFYLKCRVLLCLLGVFVCFVWLFGWLLVFGVTQKTF